MHRLLKRQLKKAGIDNEAACSAEALRRLLALVERSYQDADDDRHLLEHSLEVSSKEMQELYARVKESARREVQKSEAKYSRLIENLKQHYFFYTRDAEGEFTYVSDSVTDVLGYAKEEFLHSGTVLYADDTVKEKIKRAFGGEMQAPYDVAVFHKDGSVRMLEIMEQPVSDGDGGVLEIEGIARDVTQIVQNREKLDYLARHDPLTGISNRTDLFSRMEKMLAKAKRRTMGFAVLFIDLDHFKNVNDTLGHAVGDNLLKEVVARIKRHIREEDIFARIGGDEFVLVLDDVGKNELGSVVGKVTKLVRAGFDIDGHDLKISSSIGVSLFPEDGGDTNALLKNADIAMYEAKRSGRDRVYFFTDELNSEIRSEMQLQLDMAKGFEKGEFELYFQPKVLTSDDTIVGAEALLRWNHPVQGMIPPERFIKVAENSGLIVKLGRWVVEEGCRALAEFDMVSARPLQLSVNLSTYQLQHDDMLQVIKDAVETTGIDPSRFFIEITESVFAHQRMSTLKILNAIRAIGINICLDDFGTGYSSLSYLHRFPISVIKVDRSFVALIGKDGAASVLLDTVIAMGRTLGLDIVAEGVEAAYQRDYLLKKGCSVYQGYLFSKPLPKAEYIALIRRRAS
jgi:diguanylate cyclase (GGDEF)-like protein/PAS domain S-box-containing protein